MSTVQLSGRDALRFGLLARLGLVDGVGIPQEPTTFNTGSVDREAPSGTDITTKDTGALGTINSFIQGVSQNQILGVTVIAVLAIGGLAVVRKVL